MKHKWLAILLAIVAIAAATIAAWIGQGATTGLAVLSSCCFFALAALIAAEATS